MMCKTCLRIGLLLLVLSLSACDSSPPPPKTYPVKGKVVFAEGGAPAGGMIEFRSATEPVSALGQVQADGSFSLSTIANNKKLNGAVAGEHAVTFMPPLGGAEVQGAATPVFVKEKLSVKADAENDFTIKIAKSKAR